jgi:hypothetical protein
MHEVQVKYQLDDGHSLPTELKFVHAPTWKQTVQRVSKTYSSSSKVSEVYEGFFSELESASKELVDRYKHLADTSVISSLKITGLF